MRTSTAALLFLAAVCQVVVRGVNASSATIGKLTTQATPLGKVRLCLHPAVACAITQSFVHTCVLMHDTVHGCAIMHGTGSGETTPLLPRMQRSCCSGTSTT